MAATTLAAHCGSRKCCPNRFRGLGACLVIDPVAPLILVPLTPVAILDCFDFFLAHAEVVTNLVNERFADRADDLVLVIRGLLNRALDTG